MSTLPDSFPMLGLASTAFPYRARGPLYGKWASIVLVAPCNMACGYCDVGGYAKDADNNLPGYEHIALREIEEFILDEVAKDRIIYFSGGEPLLSPDLIEHLGALVRHAGGYSVVCTNATLGQRMDRVAKFVDEFSISLKGTSASARQVSGLESDLAFAFPYRNALAARDYPNVLEMVVVLFEDITCDAFVEIYEPFFGRARLTLKQYRPKATTILRDNSVESIPLPLSPDAVQPMTYEAAHALFATLVDRYLELASTAQLVCGAGSEQEITDASGTHVLVREGRVA